MAKLTASTRNALPKASFALPGKRAFPIPDASHARNALARVAGKSPAVQAEVKGKVAKKFPGIGQASRHWAKGKKPATVKSDRGTFGMK